MAGGGCQVNTGHFPPQLVVSTLELPRRMEDGGWRFGRQGLHPAHPPPASPQPCTQHRTRFDISTAHVSPGGILLAPLTGGQPALHRVSCLIVHVRSPLRLPIFVTRKVCAPSPVLPEHGDSGWEERTSIDQTCPCLLLLCRSCNNLAR